ncbi:MAG TPA: YciI family protein [Terriglobia bacterium]|nr:YciI family protein [Terriglobia bacterium]
MRYMLLIYANEQAREALPPEERQQRMAQALAVMEEADRCGVFEGAGPLQPTTAATTLRARDGKWLITDGPYVETKEQLGGYIILNCKDLDEALEWAAKFPLVCAGEGGVEVRPIQTMPGFGKAPVPDAAVGVHG